MKRAVIAMVCGAGLAGCSQLTNHFIVDAAATQGETTVAAQKGEEAMPPINLDTFCFPEDIGAAGANGIKPCARTAYDRALKPRAGDTKEETRLARNQLMLTIIRRSEVVCNYHKGAIMANSAAADFSTGLLSSVASTLSSAFSPVTTKTALSTVSAISSATGTGLRANIYQNVLAPAVVTEINNQREVMRSQILARKGEDISSYPITEALYEVERYHELCSFYVGLAELAKDRKPKARSKEEIQQEMAKLKEQRKSIKLELDALQGTNSELERENVELEFKIISSRIQNLMRLEEIAPGQSQASTSPNIQGVDAIADDGILASHQASVSVAKADEAVKQIEAHIKTLNDAVTRAETNRDKADGAFTNNATDENKKAKEAAQEVLDKIKNLVTKQAQSTKDHFSKAEAALKAAIKSVSDAAVAANKSVDAAANAKKSEADSVKERVYRAEALVSTDQAQKAEAETRKQAGIALEAAKATKLTADEALTLVPKTEGQTVSIQPTRSASPAVTADKASPPPQNGN